MLVRRRKSAYRYVIIGAGCSVDHCGLFTHIAAFVIKPAETGGFLGFHARVAAAEAQENRPDIYPAGF